MKNNPFTLTGALIVGYSFRNPDEGVLTIGRKDIGKEPEIINAYEGKEAYDLLQKLITKETPNEKTDIHN